MYFITIHLFQSKSIAEVLPCSLLIPSVWVQSWISYFFFRSDPTFDLFLLLCYIHVELLIPLKVSLIPLASELNTAYTVTGEKWELLSIQLLHCYVHVEKLNWNCLKFPCTLEKIFHFHSFTYPVPDIPTVLLDLSSKSFPVQTHEVMCAQNHHVSCV